MNMQNDAGEDSTSGSSPLPRIPQPRTLSLLLGFLLFSALACMPRAAWAVCLFASGSATTVTFNAGTITLTPGTQIGQVLWTSNAASPANPPYLYCYNNPTNWGITNTIATQPAPGSTLFPTGIPGVSYKILHPDATNFLPAYPTPDADPSGSYSVTSNLQLIYTGPYLPPNNSTLTGQLAKWMVDIQTCTGHGRNLVCTTQPQPVETFNISATIKIQVPTCDVDPSSVNETVTLPGITTTQFSGPGPAASRTPFSLQLIDCPNDQKVFITLNTATPQTGTTGVIAPSGTGYAAGVGVQILLEQADGTTAPVTFGSPIDTGTTVNSNYTINLFASYYQTSPTVSAGPVKATATYTLNYQ